METRSRAHSVTSVVLALAVALGPSYARAADLTPEQKVQAKEHYQNATKAEKDGRFDDALVELQAAFDVTKDPKLFFQLGRVHELANHLDEAVIAYRRFLNEAKPSAGKAAEVEATIARLEAQRAAATPTPAELPTPTEVPVSETPPAEATPDSLDKLEAEDEGGSSGPWMRTAGWVSVGAAAVLLTTGGLLAASASAREDDISRLSSFRDPQTGQPSVYTGQVREQYEDAQSEGDSFKTYAMFTFIGAGVAAAAAVTFFVLDARQPEPHHAAQEARLIPAAGPNSGGLTLEWGF